jgi:hypothetical protein
MSLQIIPWDGQPITRPGIYDGVDMDAYHNDPMLFGGAPHISSGGLRTIEDPDSNIEKFWDKYVMNPDREEREDTSHFSFGRAVHTLFLGEPGFREQFVILPTTYVNDKDEEKPWNSNANVCKAWLAKQKKDGKAVLTADQMEDIKGMALKLAKHPTIKAGLLNGLIEKSIFWYRDIVLADDGRIVRVWLKARPDVLTTDALMVVDYKTAADASPNGAQRAITDHGYFQQLALIQEGLWEVSGLLTEDHTLVFQEKKRPFSINIKPLFGSAIHLGHLLNNRGLQRFAKCWADKEWPGYENDEVPCDVMDWRSKQLQEEIKVGRLNDDVVLPGQAPPSQRITLPLPAPKPAPSLLDIEEV